FASERSHERWLRQQRSQGRLTGLTMIVYTIGPSGLCCCQPLPGLIDQFRSQGISQNLADCGFAFPLMNGDSEQQGVWFRRRRRTCLGSLRRYTLALEPAEQRSSQIVRQRLARAGIHFVGDVVTTARKANEGAVFVTREHIWPHVHDLHFYRLGRRGWQGRVAVRVIYLSAVGTTGKQNKSDCECNETRHKASIPINRRYLSCCLHASQQKLHMLADKPVTFNRH